MEFRKDINCKKEVTHSFFDQLQNYYPKTVVTYQILKIMNEEEF